MVGGVADRHLVQRGPRPVPLGDERVDELLERQVLVGIGGQRHRPDPAEQLGERRVAGQVGAHHERVDEEPDQALGLAPATARDRRTDEDVLQAAVPAEQNGERREQRHEHRRAVVSRELPQPLRGRRGHRKPGQRPGGGPHRRARPVGGQVEHWRVRQPVPPVPQLVLEQVAAQPGPLPGGVVGVLHGQRRQGRWLTRAERLVQRGQLAPEDPRRPLVEDHVVHRQRQHMVPRADPDQRRPDQRPGRQVEWRRRVGGHQIPGHRHRVGRSGHVGYWQRERRGRVDPLVRRAVRAGQQPGAQHLVPGDDRAERRAERGDVHRAELHGRWQVVLERSRLELVDEPQPLLGERQRRPRVPADRDDRRRRHAGRGALDGPGQRADCGVIEHGGQRDLGAEHVPDPGDHPGSEQRMPAELEEAIGRAHPVHAEHLRPDPREQLFPRARGRHVLVQIGPGAVGRGQRVAVQLAARRRRQRRQLGEHRGHHEAGQPLARELAQLGDRRDSGGRVGRDQVGDQAPAGVVAPRGHDRGPHPRVGREHGLDLAWLDPEAAHLDLVVEPAEVFKLPARAPPGAVAGAIGTRPVAGHRVGDEPLGGQPGPADVPAGQLDPADVELALHPDRHRAQAPVEDVQAGVGDRTADQHRLRDWPRAQPGRHVDGRLGRAVEVGHHRARLLLVEPGHVGRGERFPAAHH